MARNTNKPRILHQSPRLSRKNPSMEAPTTYMARLNSRARKVLSTTKKILLIVWESTLPELNWLILAFTLLILFLFATFQYFTFCYNVWLSHQ